jgi:molybdopterin converting factor small subunit
MKVHVKCFATLADADSCDYRDRKGYDLHDGATVLSLIEQLKMAPNMIKLIFVNGEQQPPGYVLKDGDQVGLAPAVGGM